MQILKKACYLFFLTIVACGVQDIKVDSSIKKDSAIINSITNEAWILDRIEKSKIIFKNGKIVDTHLFELTYLGQIAVINKAPYLIFSGRDCDECDASISIYIHSPDDGNIDVEMGKNRYDYPGNEKDFATDSIIHSSRVFYGQILNNITGIIWYQKVLLTDKSWGRSVFLIDLTNNKKKEVTLKDIGQIQQTLVLLKQTKCVEIKGKDYTSEP